MALQWQIKFIVTTSLVYHLVSCLEIIRRPDALCAKATTD